MTCKECDKRISEATGTRYAIVRLYERAGRDPGEIYNVDKGHITVCYDCWKDISPPQYQIKEKPRSMMDMPSTPTRIIDPFDCQGEEEDWHII